MCIRDRRESYLPGKFYIKVDSTQRALRDLAKYYKKKFPIPVVALTGSVGKTTTKDMVAAVLGEKYRVLKTEGNLNNEIGVPMTLLRLSGEHEIAVLELGMNHAGEIDYLSALVEPDVVLMTNIGDSHIEHFGSREMCIRDSSRVEQAAQGLFPGQASPLAAATPMRRPVKEPGPAATAMSSTAVSYTHLVRHPPEDLRLRRHHRRRQRGHGRRPLRQAHGGRARLRALPPG